MDVTQLGVEKKPAEPHLINDSKGWNRSTDIMRRRAGALILGVGLWILFIL